jgi:hypothetical protein
MLYIVKQNNKTYSQSYYSINELLQNHSPLYGENCEMTQIILEKQKYILRISIRKCCYFTIYIDQDIDTYLISKKKHNIVESKLITIEKTKLLQKIIHILLDLNMNKSQDRIIAYYLILLFFNNDTEVISNMSSYVNIFLLNKIKNKLVELE